MGSVHHSTYYCVTVVAKPAGVTDLVQESADVAASRELTEQFLESLGIPAEGFVVQNGYDVTLAVPATTSLGAIMQARRACKKTAEALGLGDIPIAAITVTTFPEADRILDRELAASHGSAPHARTPRDGVSFV